MKDIYFLFYYAQLLPIIPNTQYSASSQMSQVFFFQITDTGLFEFYLFQSPTITSFYTFHFLSFLVFT